MTSYNSFFVIAPLIKYCVKAARISVDMRDAQYLVAEATRCLSYQILHEMYVVSTTYISFFKARSTSFQNAFYCPADGLLSSGSLFSHRLQERRSDLMLKNRAEGFTFFEK